MKPIQCSLCHYWTEQDQMTTKRGKETSVCVLCAWQSLSEAPHTRNRLPGAPAPLYGVKFAEIADTTEKACAHPAAFALFLAWCAGMPLINVDVANYGISVLTALLLMLTLQAARRDRLAMHLKLNGLVKDIEVTDSTLAGIEELTEEEIRQKNTCPCPEDGK